MKTKMHIIKPNEKIEIIEVDFLNSKPEYEEIKKHIKPYIDGYFERVGILFDKDYKNHVKGVMSDMFVDEEGRLKNLKYNPTASMIYAAFTFKRNGIELSEATFNKVANQFVICGTALIFETRIWY